MNVVLPEPVDPATRIFSAALSLRGSLPGGAFRAPTQESNRDDAGGLAHRSCP